MTIGRILFCVAYLAIATGGGLVLAKTLPGADVRYLAMKIDARAPIGTEIVADVALKDPSIGTSCDGETLRALRAVELLHIDQQDQIGAYEEWSKAIETAGRAFRHSLRCAPADGNAWAALAMTEASISVDTERLNRILEMSFWTAPVERSAIYGRFKARRIAGEAAAEKLPAGVEADIRSLVSYFPPPEVASLANGMPPYYRTRILAAAAETPAERRAVLASAGLPVADAAGP